MTVAGAGSSLPSVAFVLPGLAAEPVGGFRVVYEYANRLAALGYPVRVHYLVGATPGGMGTKAFDRAKAVGTLLRLRALRRRVGPGAGWFALSPAVHEVLTPWWAIRRHLGASDVVVATAWSTADLVAAATEPAGKAGIYLIQHYETWNGGVAPETVDATWRLPLHKIVIAKWLQEHAAQLGESARTTYVPNGLDFDQFQQRQVSHARDGAAVSMLVSGLDWKGHRYGLEAVAIARRTHPQIQLTMFGNGVDEADLPSGDGYRFVGMLSSDDLTAQYNATGVFLHTSLEEGWGLPPAEAMACGAAVIAADNPGVLDYVIDGHNALVVPRADPQAAADALIRLVDDGELRRRLADAGHRDIRAYTWERAVDAFSEAIASEWRRETGTTTHTDGSRT